LISREVLSREKEHYIEHFTPSKMKKTRGIYKTLFFFFSLEQSLRTKRGETITNLIRPKGKKIN